MTKLVETIAKSLVGYPEKVEVTQKEGTDGSVLQLHVADEDIGRVISKQGQDRKSSENGRQGGRHEAEPESDRGDRF